MASNRASAVGPGLSPYRITVGQFRRMIEAKIFPEGARVELLGGILLAMTTNNAHDYIVTQLANLLRPLLPAAWCLREEKSIQLGRTWRPQPDIAVLRDRAIAFIRRSPRAADIALLVEVADTSYAKDSGIKLRLYAAARIPVYWIVNVERRRVEIYSSPGGSGPSAYYGVISIHPATDRPAVLLDGQDLGTVAAEELFP
jgi:Uma2 family endonuclease